ncbi:SH3 domain-containing protein [Flavobacterium sp. LaA7.5]|nr:SH3 domain-containing protein [Flavobacterium salilacus subsp. altitudinum]
MKKLLLITLTLFFFTAYCQDSKLLASCCDTKPAKSFGRCSGNASCTACSNCKYCKHCSKEGGSCGVCTTYDAPVKKKTTTSTYKYPSEYSYGDKLTVISKNLNVRKGAGTDYDIVEKLTRGDALTFLSFDGEWIEVRVVSSGKKGYVNYKYVR